MQKMKEEEKMRSITYLFFQKIYTISCRQDVSHHKKVSYANRRENFFGKNKIKILSRRIMNSTTRKLIKNSSKSQVDKGWVVVLSWMS